MRISDWSSDACSSDLTDTLYRISEGRYTLGRIAENELLQMELSLLNARNAVSNAELNYQLTTQNLIRYLDLDRSATLDLELPIDTVFFTVSTAEALEQPAEIGRASCRESRCQYVSILVVDVPLKNKH